MTDISQLNKAELHELLKKLQLFHSLKKFLWKRGEKEFDKIHNGRDFYKVEYYDFWEKSMSYVKEKSVISFDTFFWLHIDSNEIEFIPNKNLKWGMRIFFNDNMFDLSYLRFEKWMK